MNRLEEKKAELAAMPDYSIRQLFGMYAAMNVPGLRMGGWLIRDLLSLVQDEARRRVEARKPKA